MPGSEVRKRDKDQEDSDDFEKINKDNEVTEKPKKAKLKKVKKESKKLDWKGEVLKFIREVAVRLTVFFICFIIIDRVIKKLWTGSDNREDQDSEKYDIKYDHTI